MLRSVSVLKSVARVEVANADAELLALGVEWRAAVAAATLAEQEYAVAHAGPAGAAELAESDCSEPMLVANDHLGRLADAIMIARPQSWSGIALKAEVIRRELDFQYAASSDEPACQYARALIDAILGVQSSPSAPAAAAAVRPPRDSLAA